MNAWLSRVLAGPGRRIAAMIGVIGTVRSALPNAKV
jgi:hypothetical protein